VPNLRGSSLQKKRQQLAGEPHAPGRVVIVDPRRTSTVAACEVEAGKNRVLHLAIEPGTDMVLFNALLTYIAEKGWQDKAFITASTNAFDKARSPRGRLGDARGTGIGHTGRDRD
jgi:arsenite oxidase large subunit